MKKLFVVSTQIGVGKGGISTALLGYVSSKLLREKFDIHQITTHTNSGRLKPTLIAAYQVTRYCRKGDIVWLHCGPWFSMTIKLILGLLAKAKGARVITHLHSPTVDSYLDSSLFKMLLDMLFLMSDKIIVLTPWWKKRLIRYKKTLDRKVEISSNPLDSDILSLAKQPLVNSSKDNTIRLLSMARVAKGKGFEDVLGTLSLLPSNYILTIAGDGPLLQSIKKKSAEFGVNERVTFLGWVDYKNKVATLRSHDIFILPSRYDSFGMGFIEAMAAGLPVVALDYQAIPDVVPHKAAGFLCGDSSAKNLTNAVLDCVNNQTKYGIAGKAHVLNNFDNEVISENLIQIFDGLDKQESNRDE